ncbi:MULTISPECIES: hypothetical protein [unclassified Psychrobacter]|uniref:hypothetical protein n=1 Tax=unclassified Psychrobacter TaxID=196806 RepID=UPI00071E6EAD|nr:MULTISPECIES: hypothetical protein [unclassified Psychrobacter]OLF36148.1 hypothetical protein BTV98_11425 [Psychrobacter sp. Cmf 22.2]
MTNNNPFNLIPLNPTGRNEEDNVNTYAPEDMITIYEQQFLTPVPENELTEFLPALKAFYDIDDNTLDISAVIFDAITDATIIYNHKVKTGDYQIVGSLVPEQIENSEDNVDDENSDSQAYTIDCMRTFFINDVEIPYHFNLFIQGDGYSTLTEKNTVLEKIYWFVNAGFDEHLLGNPEDAVSLESINEELARLGIREMDLSTIHQLVDYIEDNLIDDKMAEALNTLIDDAE